MHRAITAWLLGCLVLLVPLLAAAESTPSDELSRKAAALEAELGKLRDSSPEAVPLLLELVDLYHGDARVFGLIGAAEKFVVHHAAHARHKEVMLKLIDGLEAASRNQQLVAACRQFLDRYPDDPACADLELRLARTLEQLRDWLPAAEAHEAVWRRQPATRSGKESGVAAIRLYNQLNQAEGFRRAGALAGAILEQLPPSEFTTQIGWQGVSAWQRAGDWPKSNQIAAEMLKRNLPADQDLLRQLHLLMAANYVQLGQRANAAESYRRARGLGDAPHIHYQMVSEAYQGGAKGAELEPLVVEFFQKYPDRQDRFALRGLVAHAYLRDGDKPKALAILAELLPHDAATHSNASVLVRENGTEPAQLAQSEQLLRDAVAKNQPHAAQLRWALAFDLYRDRMQDLDKARQTVRELITQSPTNDHLTHQALFWLLYNEPDEAQFQTDVQLILKARAQRLHWTAYRNFLAAWIDQARQNQEHAARAAWAQQRLDEANNQPLVKLWIASETNDRAQAQAARAQLLAPENFSQLSDEQAWKVLSDQASNFYHYGTTEQRPEAATLYGQLARRFPDNYDAAYSYLQSAANYGPPEVAREAALHLLKLEPKRHDGNYDLWLRLMSAVDRNQDAELCQRAYAWIQKASQQFGPDVRYADSIGDVLHKYGLQQQALDYWRRHIPLDRHNYYSRACAERIAVRLEGAERQKFLAELIATRCDYHGTYAMWLAGDYLRAGDLENFAQTLLASRAVQDERPLRGWGMEEYPVQQWVDQYRASMEASEADKRKVFTTVRDLQMGRPSAAAALALLELPPAAEQSPIERLLAWQRATTLVGDETTDWDRLAGYAQAAMARKDYAAVAALVGGMLANIPNLDPTRQQAGRDLLAQSYARRGGVGLAIDESSPVAPLLQAALYLRLGDERLAFDTYLAHRALFDQHRDQVPVDLVRFVCERHIAAGGDENHDRAEDILRGWLVKFSEAPDVDDATKAAVQLLLARNYFKAQRYEVARSEYTTVLNRWPNTPEAIEAEFGIGETFMAQKVYDQAEAVFEKLAGRHEREVVVRAEFLRGVLANRRGDLDEARDIFRRVLERVPSVELADQALYHLAEVYGSEQRYMDQLELLRTIGRLGRASKRWHAPGSDLSIVVQDSDLGISRGHARIPVRVTTQPGGDEEVIYLYSGGAGKGLFRADLPTQLGAAQKHDKVLQLTGQDTVQCDYPEEFKADFRSVPLADAEIRVAADARFEVASSKIVDRQKESFTERLQREARERQQADQRVSQNRPANQIKPGNLIYLRVHDADRDLGDQPDSVIVKLAATSGDQVQVPLRETGPHSGVFEGTARTGELPAGALASDTSIDHSPLMAIDNDPQTAWRSAPDGATPKWLSVDMKDLRRVEHVRVSSPDGTQHAPVRGYLEGSHDGRFWFRLASVPPRPPVEPVAGEPGPMRLRVYAGSHVHYTTWQQVVDLSKNAQPIQEEAAEQLSWTLPQDHADAAKPFAALWQGKFVQPRSGAVRFAVQGATTALVIDGQLHLAPGPGGRTVDVWLERGTHDLTLFAATAAAAQPVGATRAREDYNAAQVVLAPFRAADFDLEQAAARPPLPRVPPEVLFDHGVWDFRFGPQELRHLRVVVEEYLGEAVAINQIEVQGEADTETYVPTEEDLLALAGNDVLELAAGDEINATYTDELTQAGGGSSRLLSASLTATYFNAVVTPIAYDFLRQPGGAVTTLRKQLIRIDPGERFILEITDYDQDTSGEPDELKFTVAVGDGEPVTLTATETGPYTGIFTKEIDTRPGGGTPPRGQSKSADPALAVKPGDLVYCAYLDAHNTFPGHAVAREAVVYVNQPSEARLRIVETRVVEPPAESNAPRQTLYLPPPKEPREITSVAFEAPLTVEVFDRDAAKDSRSKLTVQLATTDGALVEVECVISDAFTEGLAAPGSAGLNWALEEGRFVGQVILQLGSKHSEAEVPLGASMPRNLIGGPKLDQPGDGGEALVTRVLNVTGKDVIQAVYKDELRPDGGPLDLRARGRLISNGVLACTDRDYEKPVRQLHVGEKMFLVVTDADLDVSDERDTAEVEITTERGERELVLLEETLAHSGLFTGSVQLKPAESPTAGNLDPGDPAVESYFGDLVTLRYTDRAASTSTGELIQELELPVVVGTDGLVAAFSKTFGDERLAVETQFHIAESYFELFKSHKQLEREEQSKADLEAGRRVLREVMEDYPDPKYVPRIAYLLGQFAQELGEYQEAIESYRLIVRQFPDHTLAADAQYKLAQCHEEAGNFDDALEGYVTLAATYPKSPLIANVMIRIGERFYRDEEYLVAAQVGEKFLDRFEGHEWSPRMAFRVGQCYYKAKEYVRAAEAFDRFARLFPADALAADALFWSGESFRMAGNNPLAFQRYNRCRWDFPATDAAKYSRGRLALPAMLAEFERAANVEE